MRKLCDKISIILISFLLCLSFCGCGDSFEEEEYYESEEYEEYDEESYDYEEETEPESETLTDTVDLEFPYGTCGKAEGKLVLVSVFADDASSSWDFQNSEQDLETYSSMATMTRIGCDWLEEQASKYGKNLEIISDFEADEELFYQASLNAEFDDNQYHIDEVKGFIDDSLSGLTEHLIEKYKADNICFAFYFNKSEDSQMSSCAYEYLGPEMDLPYECVLYGAHVHGFVQGPAMYAHEILHCFGAPDFYFANTSIEPICISQEFSDYCKENHINEIMYSSYDVINDGINTDAVTNELTDLTAYYLGWVDYNEECERFGALDREDK